jgi:hypothetical protein
MNEFLERLKKDIPQFDWSYSEQLDSYFGIGQIDQYQFKDEDKNTYINLDKYIIISGELYKGEERSFRYATCYQEQKFKPYRGKNFIKNSINRIYASGKTLDDVYSNLQKEPNYFKFIIENK